MNLEELDKAGTQELTDCLLELAESVSLDSVEGDLGSETIDQAVEMALLVLELKRREILTRKRLTEKCTKCGNDDNYGGDPSTCTKCGGFTEAT